MKLIVTVLYLLLVNTCLSQRVGYDWMHIIAGETISSSSVSTNDGLGDLIVAGKMTGALEISGTVYDTLTHDHGIYLAKLSSDGELMWLRSDLPSDVSAITTDAENNIYLATKEAWQSSDSTFGYLTVSKYGPSGTRLWRVQSDVVLLRSHGTVPMTGPIQSIAVDQNGEAYITGAFFRTITWGGIKMELSETGSYIVKLDTAGVAVWGRRIQKTNGQGLSRMELGINSFGGLCVSGTLAWGEKVTLDTLLLEYEGSNDILYFELDTAGTLKSVDRFGGVDQDIELNNMVLGDDDAVYLWVTFKDNVEIEGNFFASQESGETFVLKLVNNTVAYATHIQIPVLRGRTEMAVDPEGQLYLVGLFEQENRIYRIDPNGQLKEGYRIADVPNQSTHLVIKSIFCDAEGRLYVNGIIAESAYFGREAYFMDEGISSVFIGKVNWSDLVEEDGPLEANVMQVYPTISKAQFRVTANRDLLGFQMRLFNLSGQLVLEDNAQLNDHVLDLGHLQNGVYLLEVQYEERSELFKIIKV